MASESLMAISPVDGRYKTKTAVLRSYFSEYALIKYRVEVKQSTYLRYAKFHCHN